MIGPAAWGYPTRMARKSEGMPEWFTFALVASFLVMLGAGAKSGWRLAGNTPPPPPPPPPPTPPAPAPAQVQQGGILHDWAGGRFSGMS